MTLIPGITPGFTNPVRFRAGKRKGTIGYIVGSLDVKKRKGITRDWVKIPLPGGGHEMDVFRLSALEMVSKESAQQMELL